MKSFIDSIANIEVQNFILAHENDDIQKLLLKQKTTLNIPTEWIVQQLTARKKAKAKLPTWYSTPGIIYPPFVNMEQSSSEATAKFKASIISELLGSTAKESRGVDLTGGFGVDSFYFSNQFQHLDYVETNEELLAITRHNHHALHAHNINHYHASAEDFITSIDDKIDFAFIDPSRRKASQKIFKLIDSEPSVVEMQEDLFKIADYIIIKTSPLFDIQQGQRELKDIYLALVVAVENECKELLFFLKKDFTGTMNIRAVNLSKHGDIIESVSFKTEEEKESGVTYSIPLEYVYEPNTAILKAGAFRWIGNKFGVSKLAVNSHLYTSNTLKDFPGRTFRILEHAKLDKKLKDRFAKGHANIIARNYPLTVEEIKKKTGLKEGGEEYLICTQTDKEKFVLITERIR